MLLAVADYAKDDGRFAYASARTLTWKSRLSPRGGEVVLQKLVLDGELLPEWRPNEGRLYLHIRCIMDWDVYKGEGPAPTFGAKFTRSQSANFSRKLVELAEQSAHDAAAKAQTAARKAQSIAAALCTRSVQDPLRTEEQGCRPLPPPQAVENSERTPAENMRVITKVVHEVMDLLADVDDITEGDVVESVKRHCAELHIAYDSAVVWRAVESAAVQRKRATGRG
jgi:hypothetical protein